MDLLTYLSDLSGKKLQVSALVKIVIASDVDGTDQSCKSGDFNWNLSDDFYFVPFYNGTETIKEN